MIEQTETRHQETLDYKLKKQVETFSFSSPLNLVEEGKWFLGVTSNECTNSVFNITNGNNSFSTTTPGHWNSKSAQKAVDELNKLLELKSLNDIDSHVEQVRKKGIISINDYSLASLGTFKIEILEELKNSKYDDFEHMVYRFQLTNDEIIDILNLNYFPRTTIGYTLPPRIDEIFDNNLILKSSRPKDVKLNITIDDIRLKSNLTTNKTIKFTKKSLFCIFLGFTQSHSGEIGDIEGFVQLIARSCKSDRPVIITGIDKVHLKGDCILVSIVNGVREPILYSFVLDQPPGHEIHKEPGIKVLKKLNISFLSHILFYLEDDDHEHVDFNAETLSFTCQLIKI